MSNALSAPEYRALHEFRFALRQFLRFSEEAARAAGIEPQQHQLLLTIKGLPGGLEPDIATLAERLQIKHHSVVELVDRLAARGLVERVRSAQDHRQVMVRLLAPGEEVLHELSVHHRAQLREAGPALLQVLEEIVHGGHSSNSAREALAASTRTGAAS